MRTSLSAVFSLLLLCGALTQAQQTVAEGEYEMRGVAESGASLAKSAARWVLGKSSGGYHLESEIQNQPAGMRVVQIEELDDRLVPIAIGYELYRKDQKAPGITARCEFSSGVIVCTGASGKNRAVASKPYRPSGPFWLWMEGLFSLDMPWLMDGAVNMAQLEKGEASVATLTVSGGSAVMIGDAINVAKLEAIRATGQTLVVMAPDKPIAWGFSSDEESPLQFVATENLEVNGTKVAARHYTLTNGNAATNLWIAGSGLLIKLAGLGGPGEFVLTNYKQYKKLIPELQVELQPGNSRANVK